MVTVKVGGRVPVQSASLPGEAHMVGATRGSCTSVNKATRRTESNRVRVPVRDQVRGITGVSWDTTPLHPIAATYMVRDQVRVRVRVRRVLSFRSSDRTR